MGFDDRLKFASDICKMVSDMSIYCQFHLGSDNADETTRNKMFESIVKKVYDFAYKI